VKPSEPQSYRRRTLVLWSLPALLTLACSLAAPLAARTRELPALTFFVAGDSHFGAQGMEELNRSLVEQMNALPGTAYPEAIGGQVDVPRGLLFMGDMTDSSQLEDWRAFERLYGLTGRDGLLRYPVFEAIGNHDIIGDSPIKAEVVRRHGALVYSWDWEDVHFACLDLHPDAANLAWLKRDLKRVGRRRPVVVFFHYSLEGPYSDFWETRDKDALARALEGFNVLALFHGHYHGAGHYRWRGHDVFLPGSPRHSSHQFLVVRVDQRSLSVSFRDFGAGRWADTFVKTIQR
jgi:cytolysin (calcineurin-like family phosphatase)